MKKSVKGLLKAGAGIVVLASGMGLVACNGDVTTNKGSSSEKTLTVSEIYDKNNLSLDINELLVNEAEEIASTIFGESAQVKFADLDENGNLVVIAYADDQLSSVVVTIPKETAGFLVDDVKETAIGQAGYTSDQKFKENEEAKVCDKINSALDYIESQIGKISELPTGTVNYYVIGESKENLDKTFSVISPVREDGTNVLFTVYENGDLTESVIKINDVENMTTNEIWESISQGDYEIISQNELDPSSNYEEPPVEEKITIGEIFDQNFANIDFSAQLNDMFVNVVKIGYYDAQNVNPNFYVEDDVKTTIYYEMQRGERTYFGGLTFPTPNGLPNGENLKETILAQLGLSETEEVLVEDKEIYIDQIRKAIHSFDVNTIIEDLTISDLQNKIYGFATNASLPASSNAFGEALLNDLGEQGDIIATYVGDVGASIFDQGEIFDAGYISNLKIVVVYENGNCIIIDEFRVTVPVYENERGDSQAIYQHILQEGERVYSLQNRTTVEKI